MPKKLGKNIITTSVVALIVVVLVGGVSIFFSQRILHNAYKIKEESEHIVIINNVHANAYRLVLVMHHFLIDPNKIYAGDASTLVSRLEKATKEYIAIEEAELYEERFDEIEILNNILDDIQEVKRIFAVFEEFSKTGTFDKDKFEGLEKFAYAIEFNTRNINKVHLKKIAGWGKESVLYMWIILIFYIVFLIFGGFSIYIGSRLLSKNVVNPIKELASATVEFSKGSFDKRVHTGSKTEVGLLYQSFNEMAEKLQEHDKLLREFHQKLEKKVRERTLELQKANEQLRRTQDSLIRTEKMTAIGQIAAGVAHEIKNPLAGIKVSVEVLAEEQNISEEDRAVILKAIDEIRRIELLIKSLLNFAKPHKPQLMAINVNDILDKTITFSLKHPSFLLNTSTAINVLKDFDKNLPETMADPMQLQQIFLNLLLNAIDAMPDGGTLAVKTLYHAEVNSIHIAISNTGKGIDKGVIGKIFQPFFTTKSKGTGLGLAITKRLIEQHEGDICVENNPGGGTVFNIFLPVKEEGKEQTT